MGLPAAVPAWLAYTAIAAEIAGAVGAAASQVQAGRAASAQARLRAQADAQAAKDAEAAGNVEAQKIALQGGYTKGTQRAGFAAAGVVVDSGSPLELVADSALFTELDKRTAQANALRTAYGYQAEASSSLLEADMRKRAGELNAAGSLLSGFGNVAGDYYHLRGSGALKVA